MKKLIFAVLSLALLGMLPACCGCNWGCKGKKENGAVKKRTSGGTRYMGNGANNY